MVINTCKKYNIPLYNSNIIYFHNELPKSKYYRITPIYDIFEHLIKKQFQSTCLNINTPDNYPKLNINNSNQLIDCDEDFYQESIQNNLNGAGGEYWIGLKASWEQGEEFNINFNSILSTIEYKNNHINNFWKNALYLYYNKYLIFSDYCSKCTYNSLYLTTSIIGWFINYVNMRTLYLPYINNLLFKRLYNLSTNDRRNDEIIYNIYKNNCPEFINIPFYGQSRTKTWNTKIINDAPDLKCKKYTWNASNKFKIEREKIPDLQNKFMNDLKLEKLIIDDIIRLIPQKNYDSFVEYLPEWKSINFMNKLNVLCLLTELWKYDLDTIKDILVRNNCYYYEILI